MKYKLELPIHKPRIEVWKFFSNPENTHLWQPSLTKIETIHGVPSEPGSQFKWNFLEGEREFSLIETVLHCEEPARFESLFENEFASNTVTNIFVEEDRDNTRWIMETSYIFKTMLMKIAGPLLKRNYVARSQRDMQRFAETLEAE